MRGTRVSSGIVPATRVSEPDVAAIVLAGGASRRFGRDKLAEPIEGRSLLDAAVAAVRPVATTILVVLAPSDERALPVGAAAVHDPVAHEGPLAGVAAGLRALDASIERVVILGGDMPSVEPAVLGLLLERLGDPAIDAAWLIDASGRERPLPLAVRRARAAALADRLLATGERRLGALPEGLQAEAIPPEVWRSLDPDGGTLRDIDVPGDLDEGSI
jgi:molybdopterin-guanine dinucleotide biosynthesis protein A